MQRKWSPAENEQNENFKEKGEGFLKGLKARSTLGAYTHRCKVE